MDPKFIQIKDSFFNLNHIESFHYGSEYLYLITNSNTYEFPCADGEEFLNIVNTYVKKVTKNEKLEVSQGALKLVFEKLEILYNLLDEGGEKYENVKQKLFSPDNQNSRKFEFYFWNENDSKFAYPQSITVEKRESRGDVYSISYRSRGRATEITGFEIFNIILPYLHNLIFIFS